MPTFSVADGVDASYAVAAGSTTVVIRSSSPLKHRGVYVGTGRMVYHWVQQGKTEVWRCDTSMLNPVATTPVEKVGEGGAQELQVELGEVYPAGLLMQGSMVGTMMAPAVHVDVPWGADVWVFLVRSPWFPLKFQADRTLLSVQHDTSSAKAQLGVMADGSVSGQIAVEGTEFKKASLTVKRTIGSYSSNETVCEIESGSQSIVWKPITRIFDLVLVTKGAMRESQMADVARGLGAQFSSGVFGPGRMQGDFVLCDGPATSYVWILKGHRGFLEDAEDSTAAKLSW